jgi:hypothetical protein
LLAFIAELPPSLRRYASAEMRSKAGKRVAKKTKAWRQAGGLHLSPQACCLATATLGMQRSTPSLPALLCFIAEGFFSFASTASGERSKANLGVYLVFSI